MASSVLSTCVTLGNLIWETALQAKTNKQEVATMASMVKRIQPLLLEIEKSSHTTLSAAGTAIVGGLRECLERMLDLIKRCVAMGPVRAFLAAADVRDKFRALSSEFSTHLSQLGLVSVSLGQALRDDLRRHADALTSAQSFRTPCPEAALATCVRDAADAARRKGVAAPHEDIQPLLRRVLATVAYGDKHSSAAGLTAEADALQEELTDARARKDAAEEHFLSQIVATLADLAPTSTATTSVPAARDPSAHDRQQVSDTFPSVSGRSHDGEKAEEENSRERTSSQGSTAHTVHAPCHSDSKDVHCSHDQLRTQHGNTVTAFEAQDNASKQSTRRHARFGGATDIFRSDHPGDDDSMEAASTSLRRARSSHCELAADAQADGSTSGFQCGREDIGSSRAKSFTIGTALSHARAAARHEADKQAQQTSRKRSGLPDGQCNWFATTDAEQQSRSPFEASMRAAPMFGGVGASTGTSSAHVHTETVMCARAHPSHETVYPDVHAHMHHAHAGADVPQWRTTVDGWGWSDQYSADAGASSSGSQAVPRGQNAQPSQAARGLPPPAFLVGSHKSRNELRAQQSSGRRTVWMGEDAVADRAPPELLCPITGMLMADPVILVETGKTYERSAIVRWLSAGHGRCPVSGVLLQSAQMVPNIDFAAAIAAWAEPHGLLRASRRASTPAHERIESLLATIAVRAASNSPLPPSMVSSVASSTRNTQSRPGSTRPLSARSMSRRPHVEHTGAADDSSAGPCNIWSEPGDGALDRQTSGAGGRGGEAPHKHSRDERENVSCAVGPATPSGSGLTRIRGPPRVGSSLMNTLEGSPAKKGGPLTTHAETVQTTSSDAFLKQEPLESPLQDSHTAATDMSQPQASPGEPRRITREAWSPFMGDSAEPPAGAELQVQALSRVSEGFMLTTLGSTEFPDTNLAPQTVVPRTADVEERIRNVVEEGPPEEPDPFPPSPSPSSNSRALPPIQSDAIKGFSVRSNLPAARARDQLSPMPVAEELNVRPAALDRNMERPEASATKPESPTSVSAALLNSLASTSFASHAALEAPQTGQAPAKRPVHTRDSKSSATQSTFKVSSQSNSPVSQGENEIASEKGNEQKREQWKSAINFEWTAASAADDADVTLLAPAAHRTDGGNDAPANTQARGTGASSGTHDLVPTNATVALAILKSSKSKRTEKDMAIKDLDEICKAQGGMEQLLELGALPIVLRQLKKGAPGGREAAVRCIEAFASHSRDVRQSIIDEDGPKHLVELLKTGSHKCQLSAVNTLFQLSDMPTLENRLTKCRGLTFLSDIVKTHESEGNRVEVVDTALRTIANVTMQSDAFRTKVFKVGLMDTLVALLRQREHGCLREAAALTLRSMAINSTNQAAIARTAAINHLIDLSRTGSDNGKVAATRALINLACKDARNSQKIAQLGGVAPMIEMLRSSTSSHLMRDVAARALGNLALNGAIRVKIARAGAIPVLVDLAQEWEQMVMGDRREGDPWAALDSVAKTLRSLCVDNEDNRSEILEVGGVPALLDLVVEGTPRVRISASRALRTLAETIVHKESVTKCMSTLKVADRLSQVIVMMRMPQGHSNSDLSLAGTMASSISSTMEYIRDHATTECCP